MSGRWTHVFTDDPITGVGRREVLCGLGNGYVGVRGVEPEHDADPVNYPGTYVAGCFNRLQDSIDGGNVELESMVNLPNWLALTLRAEDGNWLGTDPVQVLDNRHTLDLRRGIVIRELRMRDGEGRITSITQRRLVHLRHRHVCGLQTTVTPENWSGTLSVRSEIDARTSNDGVARYRALSGHHYKPEHLSWLNTDSVLCVVETVQSRVRIAMAMRTRVTAGGSEPTSVIATGDGGERAGHELHVPVTSGQPVTIDKVLTVYTSRDRGVSEPAEAADDRVRELPDLDELMDSHALAWRQLWRRFHFRMPGCPNHVVSAVRLNLFHVLQTLTPHSTDLDVGVPARGLHGEAYRGHVFWDELFVLRTLTLRAPEVCRALLLYRFRRLDAARRAARAIGKAGAMFPWQSGSDGREESQRLHLNPASGRWIPDETARQRHVGLAVAYNVWQYWQATGDVEFLERYGAEMIVEVARFFADLTEYDHRRDRYVIRQVVGPDEFHTHYPGAVRPGIDNNTYTNVMTAWVMSRAIDALAALTTSRRLELQESLGLHAREPHRWEDIAQRIFVPVHADGILSQFEGYEDLAELDWDRMRTQHGDVQRLDRILEAEGDDPNRYRLSKQADVLMLFYLLSAEELGGLLERLGYPLEHDTIPRTIEFYLSRTSHGSTLSAVVHAWVLARSRRQGAVELLLQAFDSDLTTVHAGTTAEGIHLGAMAGSIDVLERCFAGVETRADALWLNPDWPAELGELEFDITYRQRLIRLRVSGTSITVNSIGGSPHPVRLRCRDADLYLEPGHIVELSQGDE
jgi:alpha,alpha-trehalase